MHAECLEFPLMDHQLLVENLSYVSTEKEHPLTKDLSRVMRANCVQGLRLLHQVDKEVLRAFEFFSLHHLDHLTVLLKKTIGSGGRCFLVGSGSSGQIALDLAAKCAQENIIGILAGGDSAFIRSQEQFEDSEEQGKNALKDYWLSSNDLVFLISASGSSSFQVGCAKAAREREANVCYFYNSAKIPLKTQRLFDEEGVFPVLVETGPQAIAGSTRLQAATLAELALGCLLGNESPGDLLKMLKSGNFQLEQHLSNIARIIQLEREIFSNPQANFRRVHDETSQGYVTLVADKECVREVLIDTTEISSTFSTNPPRADGEKGKKKAEFQAFLLGEKKNLRAWKTLLGRDVLAPSFSEVKHFGISEKSLANRPFGQGNLVIGVGRESSEELFAFLLDAKKEGAKTALILVSEKRLYPQTIPAFDAIVLLGNLQSDPLGLIPTVLLKQILNMISNGSMILMNKVDGNQMIDVKVLSHKLIDRARRLIKGLFQKYEPTFFFDETFLWSLLEEIRLKKQSLEEQGVYSPSFVKIAVTMIRKRINFETALEFLRANEEELQKVFG